MGRQMIPGEEDRDPLADDDFGDAQVGSQQKTGRISEFERSSRSRRASDFSSIRAGAKVDGRGCVYRRR